MDGEYFDEAAKTWDDDPAKVDRANVAAAMIGERVALTSGTTRLLEYGAGTGLVAQALAPNVGPITLAEPSAGMRAVCEAKVAAGALPAGTTIAELDLTADEPPAKRFDLIATVQVLHHVEDLDRVLAAFATLLEPGGHLAIVDLEEEDGSFHAHHPDMKVRHGFARPDLQARLEAAGFADVSFDHAYDLEKDGRSFPLFLALARR